MHLNIKHAFFMSRSQRIIDVLTNALTLDSLTVLNESNQHHVPVGSETHFKIVAVSKQFNAVSRIERHRLVNTLLKQELATGLHALSLCLYTPEEWIQHKKTAPRSPVCHNKRQKAD